MPILILCPFINWVIRLFVTELWVLYIFRHKGLCLKYFRSDMWSEIFSPSQWTDYSLSFFFFFFFHCLDDGLWSKKKKSCYFCWIPMYLFSFVDHACGIISKNLHDLLLEFYSFSSYISIFDPFWVNFCIWWSMGPTSFFCMWVTSCPNITCWALSLLKGVGTTVINQPATRT